MTHLLSVQEHLKTGQTSLPEIADSYLQSIREKNPLINGFVSVDEEDVRKNAVRIQEKIRAGKSGRLAGLVLGIKDVICEKGKKVTCASHFLRNFESVYDATVISRLRDEDALLIGRTNMDEFAMGSSTENSIFGSTRNPHNPDFVTGGSSGGSAAVVAAGMCSGSLGSDTGGSIRQPASYCGVVGLRPTYSRVSRYGLVAFASSFDSIGPFTANVTDAALCLSVIAGKDPMDNSSSDTPVPDYLAEMNDQQRTLRIGVPREYFGEGLDPEVRTVIDETLQKLTTRNCRLVPVSLPHMRYGIATYYILATAEASSNLARYDGIRYGHRADSKEVEMELAEEKERIRKEFASSSPAKVDAAMSSMDSPLIRLYKKSRTEGFGTEVKRRILLGTYVLSSGYYDAYYAKAQKVRRLIKQDFTEAFKDVDVIVSPTAPTTAFKLGQNLDDPVQMYLNDVYTISANLAGICAVSVPAGVHSNGLPVGIQFMGNVFRESDILNAALRVEELQT
ncbi:MAG: Asp-tRNA(Asn)/Glu-tRNA(Gln) amidotransferase subunit GatA [Balneolaceae bacterium]|nr:MAG: Asp-tRNA(Asn)/Glu-tRNA(Gln) amidotransferase subunit GatA [Balneolaceae bacterium]